MLFLFLLIQASLQINCSDVVLFWRIQQVIKVTANALRQQVVNREARRVDKEIKEVLGERFFRSLSQDLLTNL